MACRSGCRSWHRASRSRAFCRWRSWCSSKTRSAGRRAPSGPVGAPLTRFRDPWEDGGLRPRRVERACPMPNHLCTVLLLCGAAIGALAASAAAQPAPAGNRPDVTLGSTPSTVVWGYMSSRVAPALRIKSGTTVRVDTLSHQGLVGKDDPVTFFGTAGIKPEEVLQDAKDIYREVPHPKGLSVHVLTGPIHVEGA